MQFRKDILQGRAKGHALAVIAAIVLPVVAMSGCGDAGEGGRKDGQEEGTEARGAWEKHITEETVRLKGLTGEYTLLFLTDTHAIVRSQEASEQEAANEEARYPTFFNEEGVPSAEQFPEWIRYANENQVDAVLLGGDIIDTPSQANVQWLADQLGALDMPYLYVNGNHDWTYPWEYMTEAGKESYLPLLEPLMNGNTSIQTLDFGEFAIVGIDDSPGQVDGGVFPAYEEILAEGRPVIVLAHVPFMTQSVLEKAKEAWSSPVVIGAGNYGGIYPNEESEKFVSLTTGADSPVELVLAGHVHFYDRDVIEGERQVPQLVGGAGFRGEAILIHITGGE